MKNPDAAPTTLYSENRFGAPIRTIGLGAPKHLGVRVTGQVGEEEDVPGRPVRVTGELLWRRQQISPSQEFLVKKGTSAGLQLSRRTG